MFAPYRLVYLGIATALLGGIIVVSAETGSKRQPAPAAGPLAPVSGPIAAPVDTVEKGNLAEVGARELLTASDYERAVAISKSKPVLIFKHSTECTISGAAYRRVAAWAKDKGQQAPGLFLVNVIERRPLSREIASRAKILHESPQAILFAGAKPVWSASHEAITGEAIDAALHAAASAPTKTD